MKLKSIAVAFSLMGFLTSLATASTWNTFTKAFNSEIALYFFDADTVQKQGDTVTVWIKYVNTIKPDSDGSWATTSKYIVTCSKRKLQAITSSVYDKEGKFIKTYTQPGQQQDIVPDSIFEAVHEAVCKSNFPKDKSGELYFPVIDNDVFGHTKRYLNNLGSQKDTAPQ